MSDTWLLAIASTTILAIQHFSCTMMEDWDALPPASKIICGEQGKSATMPPTLHANANCCKWLGALLWSQCHHGISPTMESLLMPSIFGHFDSYFGNLASTATQEHSTLKLLRQQCIAHSQYNHPHPTITFMVNRQPMPATTPNAWCIILAAPRILQSEVAAWLMGTKWGWTTPMPQAHAMPKVKAKGGLMARKYG